ncbi:hypothetical protein HYH03_018294 [Edaphochlamys debaryana]|uniref:Uncharacterized protein n=1 Tax=Edaphochlamys debaryana TaxID=47281 RepID=A0A835XG74_9CHLO|nr:hypothetical protein HYH03_018294 [Edaphochlamys debaryana]|eukprot:KAG2482804.1 hypothetical protein HYH03_018294 [Edaphochlamys debaryana]
MGEDAARAKRSAHVCAMLVSQLSVLDGRVTAESLGRTIDSMPKHKVHDIIDRTLESLERHLEAAEEPGHALDRALDLAELAARHHLPQKLLLLLLAMGMPPKQLLAMDPGVVLGGLMLLAAAPVSFVGGVSSMLSVLAGAVKPAHQAKTKEVMA